MMDFSQLAGSLAGFAPMAGQQMPGMQQTVPNAAQTNMAQFYDPAMIAQNQADMAKYQQNQELAQRLMSQQYVQHSGRAGVLGSVLGNVLGYMAQNKNNDKLSDILKQQFDIQNQASQAKRQQDLQDEYRKLQENVYEAQQKATNEAKAKRDNPEIKVENGFVIDPSNPNASSAVPGYSDAQIALAGGKANAEAAAHARYAGAAESAALGQVQRIMAMPDSPVKQAMLTKALGEGGMQSLMFSGGMGGGGAAAAGGPTGDDFLKGLSPSIAGQVKAIAEGRQAPPNGMAMRSPMGQQLMAAVQQYDPTFDATNYAARSKARNAFTSGKEAQTMNAINTAIGHAGSLMEAADGLGNTSIPAWNSVANSVLSASGDPRVQNFNTARDALAGELTKAFRGSSGSEKDIQEVQNNLSSAGSPEQLKAAIAQATHLLGSKVSSLGNQYKAAFGENSQPNLLDPKAQAVLKKMASSGIDTGELGADLGVSGQQPAGGAGAAMPSLAEIQAELARRGALGGG